MTIGLIPIIYQHQDNRQQGGGFYHSHEETSGLVWLPDILRFPRLFGDFLTQIIRFRYWLKFLSLTGKNHLTLRHTDAIGFDMGLRTKGMEIDYEVALRCAELSNEVYRPFNDDLRFSLRPSIKPKLINIDQTDTQVALLEDPETQCGYVIFRGSDARRDWLINLDFLLRSAVSDAVLDEKQLDYPDVYGSSNSGVLMHKGFTDAYLTARPDIHGVVQKSAMPRWVVTGHSLGGALSKLCAVDLQYNFSPKISVETYVFGAPRVGNQAFVESFNRRVPNTWRFVNGNDVVSGLPRRWQNYRHVNTRVRLGSRLSWRIISGSLQDHRIDFYIAALTKRAPQSK